MESPNYAKWIPEAGGYVHDGSKVSTTPLYDDAGNFKVDVDLSQLQISQPNQAQPQATPGLQLNTEGSGTDVNAAATGIGSLDSVADNKENTDFGVLDTPATKSASAGEPVLSPVDQTLKDIAYHQAHNNLQGMINGYTTLQQQTGEDWSKMINNLHQQRNKKILAQDDAYSQAITQAYVNGDYQAVAQLQQEQADWRNNVGFGEAQQVEYQARQDDIQVQYVDAYQTGLNDISNALINTFGQFLNFQYNPNTDMALQVAQGYAIGAVKEQMNHTGMYYSSMTQSAITRAVAELVPVYEQMAKDEMRQNIQMLMSVGNYLMDLEQTQFNMWKGQIDVQLELNQEKRRQYQDAMDRANAWGYVSNEDSVILGVAPGSPSPQALQEARQAQLDLDKEQRELQTKLILADYNNSLEMEKMYEKAKVDDYYRAQEQKRSYIYQSNLNSQNPGNSGGLTLDQLTKTLEPYVKMGMSTEELMKMANSMGKNGIIASAAVSNAMNNVAENQKKENEKLQESLDKLDKIDSSLKGQIDLGETKYTIPLENLKAYNNYLKDMKDERDTINFISKTNSMGEVDQSLFLSDMYKNDVFDEIYAGSKKFSNDYDNTISAIDDSISAIKTFSNNLKDGGYAAPDEYAQQGYYDLIDKINNATEVDAAWGDLFGSLEKDKKAAKQRVLDSIDKSNTELYTNVKGYAGL